MDGQTLMTALRLTLRTPRQAARMVINWPFTLGERWSILALAAVVSTLSAEFLVSLTPDVADPMTLAVLSSPLGFAALQFGGLAVMAVLIFVGGRIFRGTGRFSEGLAVLGWTQVVLFGLQMLQIAAMLTIPSLASLIALASIGLTLWILPNFIAELHGFRSAVMTFFGMIGVMMAVVVALSVLLVLLFGMEA